MPGAHTDLDCLLLDPILSDQSDAELRATSSADHESIAVTGYRQPALSEGARRGVEITGPGSEERHATIRHRFRRAFVPRVRLVNLALHFGKAPMPRRPRLQRTETLPHFLSLSIRNSAEFLYRGSVCPG